jgi:hypothetical protein
MQIPKETDDSAISKNDDINQISILNISKNDNNNETVQIHLLQ